MVGLQVFTRGILKQWWG